MTTKIKFLPASIQLSSVFLPPLLISNIDVASVCAEKNDTTDSIFERAEKIFLHTGIAFRRYAEENESCSSLAIKSIHLIAKELSDFKIHNLICASTSPDFPSPATAHMILKLWQETLYPPPSNIHCFDVSSSCTSYLSALKYACFAAQNNETSLVCASEVKHKVLPFDIRLRSLFSDGCCVQLVSPCADKFSGFVFAEPISDAHLVQHINIQMGGSKLPFSVENLGQQYLAFKEPKFLFRHTVKRFVEMTLELWSLREELWKLLLQKNEFKNFSNFLLQDIPGLIYFHQANLRILEDVVQKLPSEIARRCVLKMSDVGNTVSASLPILHARTLVQTKCYNVKIPQHVQIEDKANVLGHSSFPETQQEQDKFLETTSLNFERIKGLSGLSQKIPSIDLFVGAGGGFQTIGCLNSYLIEV
jgi:3-oxoacyl-[acyl-carrier-protein] synthase III